MRILICKIVRRRIQSRIIVYDLYDMDSDPDLGFEFLYLTILDLDLFCALIFGSQITVIS